MPHNHLVRPPVLILSLGLAAAITVVGSVAVVSGAAAPSVPVAAATVAAAAPVRFAVVGDSLSSGTHGPVVSKPSELTDMEWETSANGDGLEYVGGWARPGATPDQMAAAVQPIANVDVLVILAGTNAVRTHRTLASEKTNYESIVRTMGAEHVLVVGLPPYTKQPEAALTYDHELRRFVEERGWDWADPWGFARSGTTWRAGVSTDGTHPLRAGYAQLGRNLHAAIASVAGVGVTSAAR
jgi:lysophospholipase L1-like esterase